MNRSVGLALVLMVVAACGGKQSAVEGTLVDWAGEPVEGVKITASQQQPIKGYEHFEAVTKADGTFHLRGLFPSSRYVLKPWSPNWTTETAIVVESGPQGEIAVLPAPMVIERAFSKNGGGRVTNLATGATRFTLKDGIIADAMTGHEWIVGPDQDTSRSQAENWVQSLGGDWRMPSPQELAELEEKGLADRNVDPVFVTSGGWVWAGFSSSENNYRLGRKSWMGYVSRNNSPGVRAFAVRTPVGARGQTD